MATRKNGKNNTIYLIVLLLLLLLAGWLLWKVMSPGPAPQSTGPQIAGSQTSGMPPPPAPYPALPVSYAPIPTVSFTMPPEPAPQTTQSQSAAATTGEQPVQQHAAPFETTRRAATAPTGATTTRRPSVTAAPRTPVAATPAPILSAPTRPSVASAGISGSPIQGMAIVRNKYYDSSTGRHYLFCASEKTSLIYTYEVDAGTYNEANIGLMYNPAKVANWKFVSSQ